MSNLKIQQSETEEKLRQIVKILFELYEREKNVVDTQFKYIELLENEILDLKISNKVESKKVLRPKHLNIV